MAYYDALITKWTTLTGSATVTTPVQAQAVKGYLSTLGTLTVTGSIPTLADISGRDLLACIHYAETKGITADQRAWLQTLVQMQTIPGGSASLFVAPLFGELYAQMPLTIASLSALAVALVVPWYQSNGYSSPINVNDLIGAGIITQAFAHSQGLV